MPDLPHRGQPFLADAVTNARFPELLGMPPQVPSPESPSDAEVIRAVLAGDVDAFARLVDRHHGRCLRVATHLLGDKDDAEDVVQDAFVRAYRHLGGYRECDRFGAWLLRIVVNQCRTRQAREARYLRLEAPHSSTSFGSEPEVQGAIARAVAEPPCETAEQRTDQRAELAYALSQLAPEQREAVVLRFADELSYQEISALTGVGVSALKMRVQRGCARLRTLLAEHLFS